MAARQHLTLSLHEAYPNLSYLILRQLSANQRTRLRNVHQPATFEYFFRHVFSLEVSALHQLAAFIHWLIHLHQNNLAPIPPPLRNDLLSRLGKIPDYVGWNLPALLENRNALTDFLQAQWARLLQQITGQKIADATTPYLLHFETDLALQDSLHLLVHTDALAPVFLNKVFRFPASAVPAVSAQDTRLQVAAMLLKAISSPQTSFSLDSRWADCQILARHWAELSAIWCDGLSRSAGLASLQETFQ